MGARASSDDHAPFRMNQDKYFFPHIVELHRRRDHAQYEARASEGNEIIDGVAKIDTSGDRPGEAIEPALRVTVKLSLLTAQL